MRRTLMRSKIQQVMVTDSDLDYIGSLTSARSWSPFSCTRPSHRD